MQKSTKIFEYSHRICFDMSRQSIFFLFTINLFWFEIIWIVNSNNMFHNLQKTQLFKFFWNNLTATVMFDLKWLSRIDLSTKNSLQISHIKTQQKEISIFISTTIDIFFSFFKQERIYTNNSQNRISNNRFSSCEISIKVKSQKKNEREFDKNGENWNKNRKNSKSRNKDRNDKYRNKKNSKLIHMSLKKTKIMKTMIMKAIMKIIIIQKI